MRQCSLHDIGLLKAQVAVTTEQGKGPVQRTCIQLIHRCQHPTQLGQDQERDPSALRNKSFCGFDLRALGFRLIDIAPAPVTERAGCVERLCDRV
jgi:hypothetical protein